MALINPNNWFTWGLPVVSGLLYILSFPKPDVDFFAWIALVPLLVAIRQSSPRRAFYQGWLAGSVAFLGILYWVTYTMQHYGGLPWAATLLPYFLLVAYIGLYWAGFASLLVWIQSAVSVPSVILVPVLWTSLEWVRGHALTGFPWALLGYSQYQNLPFIQIADITGVYGVSFLVALVNAAIAEAGGIADPIRRRGVVLSKFAVVILLTLAWGYGVFRLVQLERIASPSLNVGVVQANIPQDIKWNPILRRETFERFARLSRQTALDGVDLIIWPEAAMPFFFEEDLFFKHQVGDLARQEQAYLLFGSPFRFIGKGGKGGRPVLYNSAYLMDPSGNIVSRYDKMRLVPFGEYVPLSPILFFIEKMVVGIGDFGAGNRYTVMPLLPKGSAPPTEGETSSLSVSVVICFEVIFPELTRRFVKEGADLMATITNDAWFGRSSAPYQHFSMVVFRSVENRVPFVRAANTGISGFIDAGGRIRKSTDLYTQAALREEVRLPHRPTVYTRLGDFFAHSCGIITLLFVMTRADRQSKQRKTG